MSNNNRGGFFFMGLFVAVGLALGGYFIGQTMYNAKVALNTAEAKGLAERRVLADRANWDIVYKVNGAKRSEIPNLYNQAEKHQQTILNLLKNNGFDDGEIKIGVLDYKYQEFRDEDQKLVDQIHNKFIHPFCPLTCNTKHFYAKYFEFSHEETKYIHAQERS